MLDPTNRFIVVTNNHASRLIDEQGNSRLHSEVLDPLARYTHYKDEVLETPTSEELLAHLKPGDIVIACGGDGTVYWIVNQMYENGINDKTTVVPLPFGGANDISRSLYGHKKFVDIASHSNPEKAYPLEASITDAERQRTVYGLGYISLGATANAAAKMNKLRHFGTQSYKRYGRAISGALLSRQFSYANGSQKINSLFDITAQNSRMSQIFHPYNYHFFDEAFQLTYNGNVAQFIGRGALWMARQEKGLIIGSGKSITLQPQQDIYLQADGEHHSVEAGSDVTILKNKHLYLPRLKN